MRVFTLRQELCLPISLDESWSFFSEPRNLALITPPSLHLHPFGEVPESMYAGMIVTYQVQPFPGLRSTWVTEITHVEKPVRFIDEQRLGPYRFWHHTHEFMSVPGGVRTVDTVRYALPFDPFSRLALPLVRQQLTAIFSYRAEALTKRFGTYIAP